LRHGVLYDLRLACLPQAGDLPLRWRYAMYHACCSKPCVGRRFALCSGDGGASVGRKSVTCGFARRFPIRITPENILWEQAPRNRRIAETLARCGLVERSGQGMNRIYEVCIRESKPKPDFTHTDANHVWLTLHGEVQHPEFLRFLEKLGKERLESFTTQDLLVIDNVFRDEPVSDCFRENLLHLVDRE